MMYGFGSSGGWWLIGMGLMLLFWITIILLVIWGVRHLFSHEARSGRAQELEALQQRYAAGEINTAEFEQAHASREETSIA